MFVARKGQALVNRLLDDCMKSSVQYMITLVDGYLALKDSGMVLVIIFLLENGFKNLISA